MSPTQKIRGPFLKGKSCFNQPVIFREGIHRPGGAEARLGKVGGVFNSTAWFGAWWFGGLVVLGFNRGTYCMYF